MLACVEKFGLSWGQSFIYYLGRISTPANIKHLNSRIQLYRRIFPRDSRVLKKSAAFKMLIIYLVYLLPIPSLKARKSRLATERDMQKHEKIPKEKASPPTAFGFSKNSSWNFECIF